MSTTTMLPQVIADQINYLIDQLVELQVVFSNGDISVREYNTKSEELHSNLETLREQQANW